MIKFRSVASAVAVTGLAAAFALPTTASAAPAAHPEVLLGTASARALDLALNGQTVSLGLAQARVKAPALVSSANGTAILSVLGSTTSQAQVSAGQVSDGPKCNPKVSLTIVAINNACTSSTSAVSNGLAHAFTVSSVEGIDVNLNSVLSTTPLDQVSQTLTQTLQGVVNQLPAALQTTLNGATDTLGGVLSDVLKTQTAHLSLGNSTSDVQTSPTALVATAVAKGGQLDVLPAPAALNGAVQPLASVIIGSSTATATYSRATGKSTASFDPALVTVKLGATPLTPAVTIPLNVGATQTIALPAGLGSITIQVGSGNTFTNPDGSVGAAANAVKVAVQLLNQPLINLAVAGAQAQVAGSPAVIAPPASVTAPAAAPPVLPHTGGTPWIPLAGGFVLAGFLVTRRLMARAA